MSKPKMREWIVCCRVEFSGARAIVNGRTEEDARAAFTTGDWPEGIETETASTVNWSIESIEPNE